MRCILKTTFLLSLPLVLAASAAEPTVSETDLPRIPPTEPARALSTFRVRPGVRLELVASEPLVVDPIALCFDENARMFVVEMRDYSERRDERLGRIRMIEDTDGDGKFDKATVFAEGLAWPTALIWYNGGLFVGSTPDILYLKDTDGDGKADQRKVVFTGFGSQVERLNVQQLFNSFNWTLDNRIHGATGGNGGVIRCPEHPEYAPLDLRNSDFSFDPRTLEMRRENGGGQYGLSFDSAGRKFVTSNSAHIRQVMYEYRFVQPEMQYALPSPALDIPVDGPAAEVYRTSPDEPWRVIRTKWRVAGLVAGPVEGGGRPSGYFTGASGVTIYKGTALGPEFSGDAFIADVGSNLVHRKKLHPNGVAFRVERAPDEQKSEFLSSSDNWFRPVTFANAPDGALYILDMYREVVEHPWSLPANIKKYLDLNSGNDRGRIYRAVSPNFTQPKLAKLSNANINDLVRLLEHPNGWHRETASRLLFEKRDLAAVEPLQKLLRSTESPLGRIHALYALQGLNRLTDADLLAAAERGGADAREHVLRLLLGRRDIPSSFDQLFTQVAENGSARERAQLAWTLASIDLPAKTTLLTTLATKEHDAWARHAILAAISMQPTLAKEFPAAFSAAKRPNSAAPAKAMTAANTPAIIQEYSAALKLGGDAAKGKAIFLERCSSCHRLFGQGTQVGPDLESVRSAGKETILGNILAPSREISKGFETYEVRSKNEDEPIAGILANESPNGVTIRQANGVQVFIPRAQLEGLHPTGKSLMPGGLQAGLSVQQFADLLAYVSGQ